MDELNWVRIYNAVFSLINDQMSSAYLSGPRFLEAVRTADPHYSNYNQLIADRQRKGQSISRRDYFLDILMSFEESDRRRIVMAILDSISGSFPKETEDIRSMLAQGSSHGPMAEVSEDLWGADRLAEYLERIDEGITRGRFNAANTLIYACLEGFLKAFVRDRIPHMESLNEPVGLARAATEIIRSTAAGYPVEVTNLVRHFAHAVDRTRNAFSDSHYEQGERTVGCRVP